MMQPRLVEIRIQLHHHHHRQQFGDNRRVVALGLSLWYTTDALSSLEALMAAAGSMICIALPLPPLHGRRLNNLTPATQLPTILRTSMPRTITTTILLLLVVLPTIASVGHPPGRVRPGPRMIATSTFKEDTMDWNESRTFSPWIWPPIPGGKCPVGDHRRRLDTFIRVDCMATNW